MKREGRDDFDTVHERDRFVRKYFPQLSQGNVSEKKSRNHKERVHGDCGIHDWLHRKSGGDIREQGGRIVHIAADQNKKGVTQDDPLHTQDTHTLQRTRDGKSLMHVRQYFQIVGKWKCFQNALTHALLLVIIFLHFSQSETSRNPTLGVDCTENREYNEETADYDRDTTNYTDWSALR